MELIPCFGDAIAVVAVDNKDKPLSVLEIVSPKRTDLFEIIVSLVSTPWFTQRKNSTPDVIAFVYYLILPTNVPHSKRDILVFNGFNVKSWPK